MPSMVFGFGSYSISAPCTLPSDAFSSWADQAFSSGSAISAFIACSLLRGAGVGADEGAAAAAADADAAGTEGAASACFSPRQPKMVDVTATIAANAMKCALFDDDLRLIML